MGRSHGASALPDSEALRTFLEQEGTPVGVAEILRAFGLPLHLKRALRVMLHDMALCGALAWLPAGRLKSIPDMPDTARVRVTRRREDGCVFACLASDPNTGVRLISDLPDGTLVLPGDLVSLRLRPPSPPRNLREGRPLALLAPASRDLPACVDTITSNEQSVCIELYPCDKRLSLRLQLSTDQNDSLLAHMKVGALMMVRLLSHNKNGLAQVSFCSFLQATSAQDQAAQLSIITHNLPEKFPSDALDEAQEVRKKPLPEAELQHRRDLRTIPLITIDDETAQDFDDALWAERTEKGFHLIVAIADVACYVPAGSALDNEARERGTSVYLPGRTIPMLPATLSADLCSLKPGEDRLCIALDLHIAPDGTLLSGTIDRAIMRSAARLTYKQVQHCLDTSEPPAPHIPTRQILTLSDTSRALRTKISQNGADSSYENNSLNWHVICDDAGSPVSFMPRQRLPAHDLVASCMITANQFIAQKMQHLSAPGLFRVHSRSSHNKYSSDKIMARYTPLPGGHHGLGLSVYTHFTSPIRRYTDLINHRALTKILDQKAQIRDDDTAHPGILAEHLNYTETRSSSAVQDCLSRLASAYLRPCCGTLLTATVTRMTQKGLGLILTKTGTPSFLSSGVLLNYSGFYDDSHSLRATLYSRSALQPGSVLSVVLKATNQATGVLSLLPDTSDIPR
ncbi:RNB domain-containing ribonuclease [Acetobacter thailandicus]|uniref:RNB domain-containing ribonuclease n=1 Tax=Acetobacter thailandicus TaxID=1502842 RepID=UPI001BA55453|nr:ribonuclease R family protein [Acetobacter thailandicus]MBS0979267.1 VacB/RNase II family 3'-5' exoribonuclease [Acetobacter thailandicus]